MNTSAFAEFVVGGRLGPLFLGITKEATEAALGLPVLWLGKPPCIGPQVLSPGDSAVWFYYGGSVGVGYDASNKADRLHVDVDTDLKAQHPVVFGTWPLPPCATMEQVRAALQAEDIPFEESDLGGEDYAILVNGDCLVSCFPDSSRGNGRGPKGRARVIYKYASPDRARKLFLATTRSK